MNVHDIIRKLHIHLGLFLLLFIWLFSFTGLLLNHGNWKFASFWNERKESTIDFIIPTTPLRNPEPEEILRFLKITGEVDLQKKTANLLQFRVHSPGMVRDLEINLANGKGSGKVIQFNLWGKLRTLHTFNGITKENHLQYPNWWITRVWRYSMDVIAIGLIIICISSWVMWHRVRKDYKFGYVILVTSLLLSGYFLLWS